MRARRNDSVKNTISMKPITSTLFLLTIAGTSLTACQPNTDDGTEMDRFVSDLMSRMTLEEKVGQLNLKSNFY